MKRLTKNLKTITRIAARSYSSTNGRSNLSAIDSIVGPFATVNLTDFRRRAFVAERPILIKAGGDGTTPTSGNSVLAHQSLPAVRTWFSHAPGANVLTPSQIYLSRFSDTLLPYELIIDSNGKHLQQYINWAQSNHEQETRALAFFLSQFLGNPNNEQSFHRFLGPLSLFLEVCKHTPSTIPHPRLYIAQAQIADLPKQLQDDLPTPRIVKEAGKGDIYDANIWIGIPPTYTPLHKDPNPNLFVQLASTKKVRVFEPRIGAQIFRDVQMKVGGCGSESFRGEEMMEGKERSVLDDAVWGDNIGTDGFEATVSPGEALFIPKGWWHSIKSVGGGVTASVNWWFR